MYAEVLSSAAVRHIPQSVLSSVDRPRASPAKPEITISFSTISIDASNFWNEAFDRTVAQLTEVLRMALTRGKSEILMTNIAPWVQVGERSAAAVTDIQMAIEEALAAACNRMGKPVPECRLNLRGSDFDIRAFVGRERPTDHVVADDWAADSR